MARERVRDREQTAQLVLEEYTVPAGEGLRIIPDIDWTTPDLVVTIEIASFDPATGRTRKSTSRHVSEIVCPEGDGSFNRSAIKDHMVDVHGWARRRADLILGKTGEPSLGFLRPPDGLKATVTIRANKPIQMGCFRERFPAGRRG